MTTNPTAGVQTALDRILNIDWTPNPATVSSQMALMMEYLRRTVLWSKALGTIDLWPVYNIAGKACPGCPEPRPELQKLIRSSVMQTGNPLVPLTCQHYLRWAAATSSSVMPGFQLDDPFEPLIMAYERGGQLEWQDGKIYVGWIQIVQSDWYEYDRETPFVELDPIILDYIDEGEG